MNVRKQRQEAGRYEITVIGSLGPVLRRALEPWRVGPSQAQTIVRTHVPSHVDLVDLTEVLAAQGSTVTEIIGLHDRASRSQP